MIFPNNTPEGLSFEKQYALQPSRVGREFEDWTHLINFRPSEEVQRELLERNMKVQRIEDSLGSQINLDYFQVKVEKLPVGLSAEHLLRDIRSNLNNYLTLAHTPKSVRFDPFNESDRKRWTSNIPTEAVGAALSIRLIDMAAVVVRESTEDHWIFSTIHTEPTLGHPVSGMREFGFRTQDESTIIYTRGADAATGFWDVINFALFAAGGGVWREFQKTLVRRLEDKDGVAVALPPIEYRPWKEKILNEYHNPQGQPRWLD